jgi:hypothetical protein
MPESHGLHKQIIRNGIATGRNNSNLAPIATPVGESPISNNDSVVTVAMSLLRVHKGLCWLGDDLVNPQNTRG